MKKGVPLNRRALLEMTIQGREKALFRVQNDRKMPDKAKQGLSSSIMKEIKDLRDQLTALDLGEGQ